MSENRSARSRPPGYGAQHVQTPHSATREICHGVSHGTPVCRRQAVAEVGGAHSVCLAVCVSGGLKSRSARGHELISKSGSNVSLANERGRYGEVYTGTKAKAGDSQDGPAATSCSTLEDRVSTARWNLKGLRRTTGSYSMGAISARNRSAQAREWSSLHYRGEGVVVPP